MTTESNVEDKLNDEIKTFKDLENDIINTGMCCSCGACIAYCESQNFNVIEMDGYSPKFKTEKNAENCTECGVCYYICPQTSILLEALNKSCSVKDELGYNIDIIAAKTTNLAIKKVGQDGGAVSTILTYLFDEHKIDAAIVSEFDDEFKPIPKIIFDKKELVKSAGTRYSISSQILPLKDINNSFQEILEKKHIMSVDQLRIAFVGTPCQCRAINKMKFLSIKPAHIIEYVISLFCFENFDYEKLMEVIKSKAKIEPSNIKKVNIKKNFFVFTKDNEQTEIDIKDLDDAVRNHCHKCDEFTGRFSDISIGASGAPDGYSMIIIRTEKGEVLIKALLLNGLIEQFMVPPEESAEWKKKKLNWFKKLISLKTK